MSGVNGIGGNSYNGYGNFASGSKLNSAADGAAELGIVERENAQINGYEAGSNNMQSGKEAANVSDAASGSINDYLQRIRELALTASNTMTVSDAERNSIQQEIDQMKQGIADVAANTTYNTKNLLDGSNPSMEMAANANGSMAEITNAKSTLEELGIEDFDVTGAFDISKIDDALAKVSGNRSSMGAQSNGLDYAINSNAAASYNLTSAKSKLEDLDYPKAASEKKKQETLQNYSLMMQKKKMETERQKMNNMFT